MLEWPQVVSITKRRMEERSPILRRLHEITKRYNGDVAFPLPELDDSEYEVLGPMGPAVIANSVDNLGRRGASTMPIWHFPAMNETDLSARRARTRRRAWSATLAKSAFPLAHQRAMRHLAGYSACVLRVVPDWKLEMPRVVCEDPLVSFPEPRKPEDPTPPDNCAFIYDMSAGAIRNLFPKARAEMGGPVGPAVEGLSEMWTLVEWVDPDQILIGIVGPKFHNVEYKSYSNDARALVLPSMLISRAANLAGRCTVISPNKIGLAGIASQVANSVGIADLMNKIMALGIAAQERAIYPDMYAVGTPNGNPILTSGSWKDGRTGEMNLLQDVATVGQLRSDPGQGTWQLQSMLERNFNVSAGSNPAMQGETYGALRTGRAIDSIVGAQVDPMIQEMHQIVESYFPHLVDMTFDTYEGCWSDKKYTIYSGWKNDRGLVTFTPSVELHESHEMTADYGIAGVDTQQATIAIGQLLGMKLIGQKTAREIHPWVGDAESEEHQILLESIEQAAMAGFVNGLAMPPGSPGAVDPMLGELVYRNIENGEDPMTALRNAHNAMQKLQAQQAPPTPEGMGAPPALMPGVGGPAQPGQPGPPGAIGAPPADILNQHALVRALNTTVPAQAQGGA